MQNCYIVYCRRRSDYNNAYVDSFFRFHSPPPHHKSCPSKCLRGGFSSSLRPPRKKHVGLSSAKVWSWQFKKHLKSTVLSTLIFSNTCGQGSAAGRRVVAAETVRRNISCGVVAISCRVPRLAFIFAPESGQPRRGRYEFHVDRKLI